MPSDLLPASSYMSFLNDISYSSTMDAVPTFVAKDMSLVELNNAKTDFLKIYNQEAEESKKGFQQAVTAEDKVLNLRKDNEFQTQKLNELKSTLGFDGRLFDLKEEDFNNPYKIKEIESKAARFVNDPNYLSIARDQAYWDAFQTDIKTVCAGKDANSALCAMAKLKGDQYLADTDGTTPGMSLQASDFMPLDIPKDISDDIKKLPEHTFLTDPEKGPYRSLTIEERTKRSKDLVYNQIMGKMQDKRFYNNLVANGYDTPEKQKQFMDQMADEYAKENVSKFQFKFAPTGGSGGGGFTPASTPVQGGYFGFLRTGALDRYTDFTKKNKGADANKLTAAYGGLGPAFNAAMAWLDKTNPGESETIARQVITANDNTTSGSADYSAIKSAGFKKSVEAGNPYALAYVVDPNASPELVRQYVSMVQNYDVNNPNLGGLTGDNKKLYTRLKSKLGGAIPPALMGNLKSGLSNPGSLFIVPADLSSPSVFSFQYQSDPLQYYSQFGAGGAQPQPQSQPQGSTSVGTPKPEKKGKKLFE
jgi:hypothetical protein